ncbi:hypothetical protein TNCV_3818161 [Trichonephila clavipes]|nr:hypothetical protein TNCV_3818161 [Trichonephila clavipes]
MTSLQEQTQAVEGFIEFKSVVYVQHKWGTATGVWKRIGEKHCLPSSNDELKDQITPSIQNGDPTMLQKIVHAWLLNHLTQSLPQPTDDVVRRVFIKFSALEKEVTIHLEMASERAGLVRPSQWRTATAGSDVVQSGRPIFDDFFQHLWPYIGNNTANAVFQMVKRFLAYPHRPITLHSSTENNLAV